MQALLCDILWLGAVLYLVGPNIPITLCGEKLRLSSRKDLVWRLLGSRQSLNKSVCSSDHVQSYNSY